MNSLWKEAEAIITGIEESAYEAFSKKPYVEEDFDEAHQRDVDLANKYTREIDAACLHFIKRRKFPHVSPEIANLVRWRFHSAAEFLEFLRGIYEERRVPGALIVTLSGGKDVNEVLRFLLLDYWHFAGFLRWMTFARYIGDIPPTSPASLYRKPMDPEGE